MKIFTRPETTVSKEGEAVKKNGKGKKHAAAAPAPKPQVSEAEIREKLASHVETSNTAKAQLIQKNSKPLGAGFMNSDAPPVVPATKEVKVENDDAKDDEKTDSVKESHLLLSDVKLNDPKDPNTQEKLKSVLVSGAFNFNPREKETLEKILAG